MIRANKIMLIIDPKQNTLYLAVKILFNEFNNIQSVTLFKILIDVILDELLDL